jgi:hypothetical protein
VRTRAARPPIRAGPGAERSQFSTPSGPGARRRANPSVRLWCGPVREDARPPTGPRNPLLSALCSPLLVPKAEGRDSGGTPRAACDRIIKDHPLLSQFRAPEFSRSAAGRRFDPPGRPGPGSRASGGRVDPRGAGRGRAVPGIERDTHIRRARIPFVDDRPIVFSPTMATREAGGWQGSGREVLVNPRGTS